MSSGHVIDLGYLIVERRFEVSVRLDVATDRRQIFHACYICFDVVVLAVKRFFSEPLHKIAQFKQVKVEELHLSAYKELLILKVSYYRTHHLHRCHA